MSSMLIGIIHGSYDLRNTYKKRKNVGQLLNKGLGLILLGLGVIFSSTLYSLTEIVQDFIILKK